jgi:hypothetical protein
MLFRSIGLQLILRTRDIFVPKQQIWFLSEELRLQQHITTELRVAVYLQPLLCLAFHQQQQL